eukprot:g5048.t1
MFFSAAASDFEIRESLGKGRGLVGGTPGAGEKTPSQVRHERRALWNSRPDVAALRYHHPTPKEGRQSPDSFKDTSHLTKWQTSKISPPRPQYSSKKHGKRHIPAPWAKSNMRAVIAEQGPAVPKQAANIFGPKLGCNRGSTQVAALLQHQVEKPSDIKQASYSGKRGAGFSNARQADFSAARHSKLISAENNRVTRDGVLTSAKKKQFYSSDAANYFGYQSAVGRNPNPIGRAPKRSELEKKPTALPTSPSANARGTAGDGK